MSHIFHCGGGGRNVPNKFHLNLIKTTIYFKQYKETFYLEIPRVVWTFHFENIYTVEWISLKALGPDILGYSLKLLKPWNLITLCPALFLQCTTEREVLVWNLCIDIPSVHLCHLSMIFFCHLLWKYLQGELKRKKNILKMEYFSKE